MKWAGEFTRNGVRWSWATKTINIIHFTELSVVKQRIKSALKEYYGSNKRDVVLLAL